MKKYKSVLVCMIFVIFIISPLQNARYSPKTAEKSSVQNKPRSSESLEVQGSSHTYDIELNEKSLSINGDGNLKVFKQRYAWDGIGTSDDPIVIRPFAVEKGTHHFPVPVFSSITIKNTERHIRICGIGSGWGIGRQIHLNNTKNVVISRDEGYSGDYSIRNSKNIKILGCHKPQSKLEIRNCENVVITKSSSWFSKISVWKNIEISESKNVDITSTSMDSIYISSTPNVNVKDNKIHNRFSMSRCDNADIARNTAYSRYYDNLRSNFMLMTVDDLSLTNNRIYFNSSDSELDTALFLDGIDNATITGNKIKILPAGTEGDYGIAMEGCHDNYIIGNTIENYIDSAFNMTTEVKEQNIIYNNFYDESPPHTFRPRVAGFAPYPLGDFRVYWHSNYAEEYDLYINGTFNKTTSETEYNATDFTSGSHRFHLVANNSYGEMKSENLTVNVDKNIPFRIEDGDLLEEYTREGDGSADNPYIIEGFEINASRYDEFGDPGDPKPKAGIHIENIDEHIIIKDSNIYDGNMSDDDIHGIYLHNVKNIKILNNKVYNNSYGYYINNTNASVISGNEAIDNDGYGFLISNDRYEKSVIDNTAIGNGFSGFQIGEDNEPSSNVELRENTAKENKWGGIDLFLASNTTVSENIIIDNGDPSGEIGGGWGILLTESHQNEITENTIFNNSLFGIGMDGSDRNVVLRNNIENNGRGFYLESSDNNNIRNNNITSNKNDGMRIMGTNTGNIITDNIITNNTRYGIYLESGNENNTIRSNDIVWNGNYSVSSPDLSLEEETIRNNNCTNPLPQTFEGMLLVDAIHSNGTAMLIWEKSYYAQYYAVYYYNDDMAKPLKIDNWVEAGDDLYYLNLTLLTEGEHTFYVKSFNEHGYMRTDEISTDIDKSPGDVNVTTDADDPDPDGSFRINWSADENTDNYSLYQNTFDNPLMENTNNRSYDFDNLEIGIYEFYIVTINEFGTSLAGYIEIRVGELPDEFSASSDASEPDNDGDIELFWDDTDNVDGYSIYKYYSPITEINDSVDVVAKGIQSDKTSYTVRNLRNGTYYFAVVAENEVGHTISDSVKISVKVHSAPYESPYPAVSDGVYRFFSAIANSPLTGWLFSGIMFVLSGAGLVILKKRKRRNNLKRCDCIGEELCWCDLDNE